MNASRFTVFLFCVLALNACATALISKPWNALSPSLWPASSPWRSWIKANFVLEAPWSNTKCFHAWSEAGGASVPSPIQFNAQVDCPLCWSSTAAAGYAADPNDCQRYYSCVPHGGQWSAHHMKCPDCLFWDQRILTCVPVQSGCPSKLYTGPTAVPAYKVEERLITCLSFDGAMGVKGSNGIYVENTNVRIINSHVCLHGKCAEFNHNSVLEIPYFVNNYDHFKQFSISFFYAIVGGPIYQGIVVNNVCGKGPTDNRSIFLISPNVNRLNVGLKAVDGSKAQISTSSALDHQWHHVVMSWDGKYLKVYLDAVLLATKPFAGPIANTMCPMMIGNMLCPGKSCYFRGYMDEICFYKSALSQKEVHDIKSQPGTSF